MNASHLLFVAEAATFLGDPQNWVIVAAIGLTFLQLTGRIDLFALFRPKPPGPPATPPAAASVPPLAAVATPSPVVAGPAATPAPEALAGHGTEVLSVALAIAARKRAESEVAGQIAGQAAEAIHQTFLAPYRQAQAAPLPK